MPLHVLDRGAWRTSYAMAFVVAVLGCLSIVAERLTHGTLRFEQLGVLLVSLAATGCAIGVRVLCDGGRRGWTVGAAQVLGAFSAIALVHSVLFVTSGRLDSGLVEGPRQLVNDVVLVGTVLGLAWSVGVRQRFVRAALPVLCIGLVGLYHATASAWHLDDFPGFAVQRHVVQQFFGAAVSLWLFDVLAKGPGSDSPA